MRQLISYGFVKAIYLDRDKVLKELRKSTKEALKKFSEIRSAIALSLLTNPFFPTTISIPCLKNYP